MEHTRKLTKMQYAQSARNWVTVDDGSLDFFILSLRAQSVCVDSYTKSHFYTERCEAALVASNSHFLIKFARSLELRVLNEYDVPTMKHI